MRNHWIADDYSRGSYCNRTTPNILIDAACKDRYVLTIAKHLTLNRPIAQLSDLDINKIKRPSSFRHFVTLGFVSVWNIRRGGYYYWNATYRKRNSIKKTLGDSMGPYIDPSSGNFAKAHRSELLSYIRGVWYRLKNKHSNQKPKSMHEKPKSSLGNWCLMSRVSHTMLFLGVVLLGRYRARVLQARRCLVV